MTEYEAVIGLECHVELSTRDQDVLRVPQRVRRASPTPTCARCAWATRARCRCRTARRSARIIKIGLALGSEIAPHSLFHRKNYFYPDMPKNYQISQYDLPICVGGHLDVELPDGSTSTRRHHARAHGGGHRQDHPRERDRAGSTTPTHALVDFNRAGVPLVECVSEPDMRSPEEAGAYLRELRATLESLDVSDVRMEEGSLRCDANVSLRPAGAEALGTKVEIKNMNSIRSLERALALRDRAPDRRRSRPASRSCRRPATGTRTPARPRSMRSKEEAFDYRYFPEPDIPALEPDAEWIEEIRAALPELPRARRDRYVDELGLKPDVARVLVADRASSRAVRGDASRSAPTRSAAANWVTQDVAGFANKPASSGDRASSPPRHLADLIALRRRRHGQRRRREAGARGSRRRPATTIGAIVERRGPAPGLRRRRARRDRRRGDRRATPTRSRSSARARRA